MNEDFIEVVDAMTGDAIRNYVVPGLTSELVGGPGRGCVRLFTSDRDTREWVTPHSHRFDFTCLVLAGTVENTLFTPTYYPGKGNLYTRSVIVPVGEGLGKYERENEYEPEAYEESSKIYGPGQTYSMIAEQIHSISFSRGAKVLIFEGPPLKESSVVLEPYSDGATVHTFEKRPWMFQR